ncbi:hypothetical protein [Cytobacillus oceanisediminis]
MMLDQVGSFPLEILACDFIWYKKCKTDQVFHENNDLYISIYYYIYQS